MNQLVRDLFDELSPLTPAERQRVLAERSLPGEIRTEVEALLQFDSRGGEGLTSCVSDVADGLLRTANERQSTYCGPYRLISVVGLGGMGAVYLAERSDGEIQQRVAIKLLGVIADRPSWRDRFLKERQLLASLNHPSIVHVIDAGHSDSGEPYLAMEYVEGVPIDLFAAKIEVRERLELFLKVCEGVAHAHRHLIIHRDLKPSNILVEPSGQPKLLDFGIAKLLDGTGDATETIERLLTPNYASPEQLRGAHQTTATDVYSLGAVLYKLLTGRSPHEAADQGAAIIGVSDGTWKVPSPSRLNPALPSDIDYILRKCLRSEPEDRYASVDAFAGDIQALLDWRPVQARSGDLWYRTRRFLRRYRLQVGAAALATVSLSAGLYVANRERLIAQRRFLEVRQLANRLFDIDAEVRQSAGTTKARQMIVDTSLEYLQRLASEIGGDPELALEVGNAYMRVARVQGVPMPGNLGQMEQADRSLQAGQRLLESVHRVKPNNRIAMLRSAQIAHDRMMVAWWLKRPGGQSLAFAKDSAGWLDRYLSTGPIDSSETDTVLLAYLNVAKQFLVEQHPDDALRICRRTADLARSLHRPRREGAVLEIMAEIDSQRGELDEALNLSKESARLLEPPSETADIGKTMNFTMALIREGQVLDDDSGVSLGRPEDAAVPLGRAFRIAGDMAGRDTNDFNSAERFAAAGILLAGVLRHVNPKESLDIYDRAYHRMADAKDNARALRTELQALTDSIDPLLQLRRYLDARQRLDAVFSLLRQLKLYPVEQVALGSPAYDALMARADYDAVTGNGARGVDTYRELLDRVMAASPKPESRLGEAFSLSKLYRGAAKVNRQAGHAGVASALDTKRTDLWRQWETKLPGNPFVRRQLAAAALP